jgi:hypothetical protein
MLVELGHITLKEQYIDGTKMESRANKYTFVWKKSVEKNKAKLEAKIRCILQEIETGIASDGQPDDEPPTPINSDELRERVAQINRENKSKQQQKQLAELENKMIPKLVQYEQKLAICGARNSYSKTDTDATFMRLKEDAMSNGQLKPCYNLQAATENQFYTNFAFFPNPNDTRTLIPFFNLHQLRYNQMPKAAITDAGYGSEENYAFLEKSEIAAFVKYSGFYKEQKSGHKNNLFLTDNLYYNAEKDYFVCPMGQHMPLVSKHSCKSESGYCSQIYTYQAQNCNHCPMRGPCHQSNDHRQIGINHTLRQYKKKAKELLTSEEGLRHRSRRCIEPEAVFGQTKANKQYERFRHFGKDLITMDFAIFAISFNLGKLWNILQKGKKSSEKHAKIRLIIVVGVWFDKKTPVHGNFIDNEKKWMRVAA